MGCNISPAADPCSGSMSRAQAGGIASNVRRLTAVCAEPLQWVLKTLGMPAICKRAASGPVGQWLQPEPGRPMESLVLAGQTWWLQPGWRFALERIECKLSRCRACWRTPA